MTTPSRTRRWTTVAAVFALVLAACAPAVQPDEVGEVEFVLTDNSISPGVVKVKAGQKVRFIVRNEGRHLHEFMIGREPHPGVDYLQGDDVYEAFEVDFFEGLEVSVSGGMPMNFEGMEEMEMGADAGHDEGDGGMEMGGEAGMEMGADAGHGEGDGGMEMGDGEEAPHGAMVMLQPGTPGTNEPGETTVIEFTVPEDRVGVWEIGCFQEAGQHYEDGMRATLIVEA